MITSMSIFIAWLLIGILTLGLLLWYFEALRRTGMRGPWMGILAMILPLFLGLFYLQSDEGTCENLPPPFINADQSLAEIRDELKWRLRTCGGTQQRWIMLIQVEQELQAQQDQQDLEDLR